jgi:hypothetical protein
MLFVETKKFTEQITDLVSDETYREFQNELVLHPDKGDMMPGCGGVRKVRMAAKGKGTSGGARVIYLHIPNHDRIYLLYLFTKGTAANLSAEGKKAVREIAQAIKIHLQ